MHNLTDLDCVLQIKMMILYNALLYKAAIITVVSLIPLPYNSSCYACTSLEGR